MCSNNQRRCPIALVAGQETMASPKRQDTEEIADPPSAVTKDRRRRPSDSSRHEDHLDGVKSISDNRFGEVGFDAKGNGVWEWKTEEPRRREDDPTIDLIKCLDIDALTLAEDSDQEPPENFNPYQRDKN